MAIIEVIPHFNLIFQHLNERCMFVNICIYSVIGGVYNYGLYLEIFHNNLHYPFKYNKNMKTQQYLRFQKQSYTITCKKSINVMYMFDCNYNLQCTPKNLIHTNVHNIICQFIRLKNRSKVVQVKTFPSISNWIVWGSIDYIKHHFLYEKRKPQFVKEQTLFSQFFVVVLRFYNFKQLFGR